ncbi:MAG: hypothetical protein M3142_06550, partial [Bacteroidota bacterium]|nr:hypothetical protein [Bacteroidota bacterium]
RYVCRKRKEQHLLLFQNLLALHNFKDLVLSSSMIDLKQKVVQQPRPFYEIKSEPPKRGFFRLKTVSNDHLTNQKEFCIFEMAFVRQR